MTRFSDLPRPAVLLGLAGVLPQMLCLGAALALPQWHWVALAAGCFYAATILSFLGGLWWMRALAAGSARLEPYGYAVIASLAGWAALLPWCLGWSWPGPSLIALAVLLAASPWVDMRLARSLPMPAGWIGLRRTMAWGLAALTAGLGLLAA